MQQKKDAMIGFSLQVALWVRKAMQKLKNDGKIKEEDMKEINTAVRNGIYSGVTVIETESPQAQSYSRYMDSMIPTYWESPKLLLEAQRIIDRSEIINTSDLPQNPQGFMPPPGTKVVVLDMTNSDPATLTKQLAEMIDPILRSFHNTKQLQKFEIFRQGKVVVVGLELTRGDKFNIIAEFEKPTIDWMTTHIKANGDTNVMSLQQAVQFIMLNPDMFKDID